MAVKLLNSAEQRGKEVSAGNVAHYSVVHARSARRSYAAGSSDVMHPKKQMKHGEPQSFDEAVKEDECGGEPPLLSDVICNNSEDPATKAARKLDWETFMAVLNDRCRAVVQVLAGAGRFRRWRGGSAPATPRSSRTSTNSPFRCASFSAGTSSRRLPVSRNGRATCSRSEKCGRAGTAAALLRLAGVCIAE